MIDKNRKAPLRSCVHFVASFFVLILAVVFGLKDLCGKRAVLAGSGTDQAWYVHPPGKGGKVLLVYCQQCAPHRLNVPYSIAEHLYEPRPTCDV